MPADNLAVAAFVVKATLPRPTLAELWKLAYNGQTREQLCTIPMPPGTDSRREAVQQSMIRIQLLAEAAVNVHLEHTRPMPQPTNSRDPYRLTRQWQTHDWLLRALRGFGLMYRPNYLAPPEIIHTDQRRQAAEQPRLLPRKMAARHERKMQSLAARQCHASAEAAALLTAWHTAQGRGEQYDGAGARTRLESDTQPSWLQETSPTLETWLESLPARSHWLLNWTGAAAEKRRRATLIYQDALQEVRNYGAKMKAIHENQDKATTSSNAGEGEPCLVGEPMLVQVKERHLDEGHPFFPDSCPLALAATEAGVPDPSNGEYVQASYQNLRIHAGSPRVPKRTCTLSPELVHWLEQYLLAYVNPERTRPDPIKFQLQNGRAELLPA